MSNLTVQEIRDIAVSTSGSEAAEQKSVETYKQWLDVCKMRRAYAFTHPLRHPGGAAFPQFLTVQRSFHQEYLTWHLRLVLHAWPQPQEVAFWEGSATFETDYPDTENEFGQPESGTPFWRNWTNEQKKEARNMLNDLFGNIIRYSDDTQRVYVTEGGGVVETHLGLKVVYEPQHLGWIFDEVRWYETRLAKRNASNEPKPEPRRIILLP